MNVVDSSGWLEYFADSANADFFAPAIEDLAKLVIPSISLFEVFKRIALQHGEQQGRYCMAIMQRGQVVTLDAHLALSAAELSIQHKLPMADSSILATARSVDATLWTQDEDFAGIAGVKYIPKPSRR